MNKHEILGYSVKLFKPSAVARHKIFAVIECKMKAISKGLYIYFLYPDSKMPENNFNPTVGFVQMYVPGEHFSYYLDLLRNEKPVFAFFNILEPPAIAVGTGKEPVGEGEPGWNVMEEAMAV